MRTRIFVALFLVLVFCAITGTLFIEEIKRAWIAIERSETEIPASVPKKSAAEKAADARQRYAFESLVERLPKGKSVSPTTPLDEASKKRWEVLDRNIAHDYHERAELLKALHEETRQVFVQSPGEGPLRVIGMSPEDRFIASWLDIPPPGQPGEAAEFPMSPGEALPRVPATGEFDSHHERAVLDFFPPAAFGYVRDRRNVVGFRPHGFRRLHDPDHASRKWRVQHVQLVGILKHDEPVVYLTDKMPSMEQVRQGKTRTLDFFEEAALPSLRDGEDLYIVQKGSTLRMLGALRATKVCQQCHDAEIGDLLGAFSYTLRPAPKETSPMQP